MNTSCPSCHRRDFLRLATLGSATLFTTAGAFAEALTLTPPATEGPFYPDKMPLDTDNDLIVVSDRITPAVGAITHLSGHVFDIKGRPIPNALVEIWQCDSNGVYLHTGSSDKNKDKQDKDFQGYGRFLTDRKGRYYFRTIKPAPYPGRTPHIHFAISKGNKRILTTQMYVKGDPGNPADGILKQITDPNQLASVMIDLRPIKESHAGDLQARFDIVVGWTPEDHH
ncbi:MAG: intradiol ring-cleavage dioxygenase [Verrucomicrobiae bacterium]|nr:intradiol ring-cleavage dioxygenase [Verrucomicrobiae bacterium]